MVSGFRGVIGRLFLDGLLWVGGLFWRFAVGVQIVEYRTPMDVRIRDRIVVRENRMEGVIDRPAVLLVRPDVVVDAVTSGDEQAFQLDGQTTVE